MEEGGRGRGALGLCRVPLSSWNFVMHARSTACVVSYVTNPNPRGLRVCGSHMMTQSTTWP